MIVTPSQWLKDRVEESFINNCTIKVINNGITIRNNKYEKNKRFTIIAVALYWTEEKGLSDLIKIIDSLEKYTDIDIVIIEKKFKYKGNNKNVKYIEYIDNIDSLYKYYGQSHLFINPTKQEVFGLVNIETLSCGTPVITYNTGGCSEIIDEKVGYIVKKGHYNEIVTKIIEAKSNYRFSYQDLINKAKEYDVDKMIYQYEELYKTYK